MPNHPSSINYHPGQTAVTPRRDVFRYGLRAACSHFRGAVTPRASAQSLTISNRTSAGGALFFHKTTDIIKTDPWITDPLLLSTDAFQTGAGTFFDSFFFHTPFPDTILTTFGHDINTLQLLSIMAALKLWGELLPGKRFILQCDNTSSVQALNSGHLRVPGKQACLRKIWFLSALYEFELRVKHIPSRTNTIADLLSSWRIAPSHEAQFHSLTADLVTTHVHCPPDLFSFDIMM